MYLNTQKDYTHLVEFGILSFAIIIANLESFPKMANESQKAEIFENKLCFCVGVTHYSGSLKVTSIMNLIKPINENCWKEHAKTLSSNFEYLM